jgi:hypothetical protein
MVGIVAMARGNPMIVKHKRVIAGMLRTQLNETSANSIRYVFIASSQSHGEIPGNIAHSRPPHDARSINLPRLGFATRGFV